MFVKTESHINDAKLHFIRVNRFIDKGADKERLSKQSPTEQPKFENICVLISRL
jgi:hypothetical protein